MSHVGPGIGFGEGAFDSLRILEVRHTLMEHPLLRFPSLVALAKPLAEAQSVRSRYAAFNPSEAVH